MLWRFGERGAGKASNPRLSTWLARCISICLVVVAVATTATGVVLWRRHVAAALALPTRSATLNGLDALPQAAAWEAMDQSAMSPDPSSGDPSDGSPDGSSDGSSDGSAGVSPDGSLDDSQGGYQMPAQMMPGAPAAGEVRLGVPLTLENTGGGPLDFGVSQEFQLGGGKAGGPRTAHSDTFGGLAQLAPHNAVRGVVYFDTPPPGAGDPPLYLLWKRGGQTRRLLLSVTGTPGDPQSMPGM
ncbi:hypothetical protein [Kitasatospora mediocidica]|uniref:hypothetical protein n=1 Tax=Kitasatospora mediocidica TaxID=58352 RepID=UPI00055BDA09|nr:hypothetical protein [Kitasatospora mediocidica]